MVPGQMWTCFELRATPAPQPSVAEAAQVLLEALPAHAVSLHIDHNDHKASYASVEDQLWHLQDKPDEWLSQEDRAAAIDSDELWQIQWYPFTPIGFQRVFGSTLAAALAAVIGDASQEGK